MAGSSIDRRQALQLLAAAPATAAIDWSLIDLPRLAALVQRERSRGQAYQPAFFTAHEWETVRPLSDLILPADERSGSATDAGVPEFLDFIVQDRPELQIPMRGGLAWLDTECRERFGKDFVACADGERRGVLDDIAWPSRARPELSHGVEFFNRFRDLTATGFWSSQMGVADLQYIGNTVAPQWNGCGEEQLRKLGVRYDD